MYTKKGSLLFPGKTPNLSFVFAIDIAVSNFTSESKSLGKRSMDRKTPGANLFYVLTISLYIC